MKVTITDATAPTFAGPTTVDSDDVAATIRGWFAAPDGTIPAEVDERIDDLDEALRRREHRAYGIAEYLGLTIELQENG